MGWDLAGQDLQVLSVEAGEEEEGEEEPDVLPSRERWVQSVCPFLGHQTGPGKRGGQDTLGFAEKL